MQKKLKQNFYVQSDLTNEYSLAKQWCDLQIKRAENARIEFPRDEPVLQANFQTFEMMDSPQSLKRLSPDACRRIAMQGNRELMN